MSTKQRRARYIADVCTVASRLLADVDALNALRATWDAQMVVALIDASGNNPKADGYNPGDFDEEFSGIRKEHIASVVGTTLDALNALLSAGHRTNLERVRQ